jgi:hypothetical protein
LMSGVWSIRLRDWCTWQAPEGWQIVKQNKLQLNKICGF